MGRLPCRFVFSSLVAVLLFTGCGKELLFEPIPPPLADAGRPCRRANRVPRHAAAGLLGSEVAFPAAWLQQETRLPTGECVDLVPTAATADVRAPSGARVDATIELLPQRSTVRFTPVELGLHSFDIHFEPTALGTTSGLAYVAEEIAGTLVATIPSKCRARVEELAPLSFVCDGRLYVDGGFVFDFALDSSDDVVVTPGVVWQISSPELNGPLVVRRFELDGGAVQRAPAESLTLPFAHAKGGGSRDGLFLLYQGGLTRVAASGGVLVAENQTMPADRPVFAVLSASARGVLSAVGLPGVDVSRVCSVAADAGRLSGDAPDCELIPGTPLAGRDGWAFMTSQTETRSSLVRITLGEDGVTRTVDEESIPDPLTGGYLNGYWPSFTFAGDAMFLLPRQGGDRPRLQGVRLDGGSGRGGPSLYWHVRGETTDVYRR